MAGDWIPMRLDLAEDPAVLAMAEELNTTEDHVVGMLHRVWSWASRQCHDGIVTNVTAMSLGRVTNVTQCVEQMSRLGWLIEGIDAQGRPFIEFPKWNNWLSNSAKKRLVDARRQRKRREKLDDASEKKSVTKMSRSQRVKSVTTGEERREEKSKDISCATDTDLLAWIARWNQWHQQGLVAASVRPQVSDGLRKAWKRVSSSKELSNLLSNPDAILDALKKSEFCRQGWFRLEKLLGGVNKDRVYIVQVLLDGGYAERPIAGRIDRQPEMSYGSPERLPPRAKKAVQNA